MIAQKIGEEATGTKQLALRHDRNKSSARSQISSQNRFHRVAMKPGTLETHSDRSKPLRNTLEEVEKQSLACHSDYGCLISLIRLISTNSNSNSERIKLIELCEKTQSLGGNPCSDLRGFWPWASLFRYQSTVWGVSERLCHCKLSEALKANMKLQFRNYINYDSNLE